MRGKLTTKLKRKVLENSMENAQTTSCDNSLETLDNKYKRTIDSESLVDPLTEVPVEIKLDDPTRTTPA